MKDTHSPGNNAKQNIYPERILILYDNPMEEHTVIGLVEAHGYNIKDKKDLEKAIQILKTRAARIGAHAVILMPGDDMHGRDTKQPEPATREAGSKNVISGKVIRYKHFYY